MRGSSGRERSGEIEPRRANKVACTPEERARQGPNGRRGAGILEEREARHQRDKERQRE